MKHFLGLTFFLFLTLTIDAQTARTATTEYNGQKYPCQVIEYNLPPGETENVIKEQLKKEGYSPSKSKGYLVFRDVRLQALNDNTPHDVFFKIERKSKKESDKSQVTLITSNPGEIPESKIKGSKGVAHLAGASGGDRLLQSFQDQVQVSAHHLAVDNQSKEIARAEKDLETLQKEQTKLEKKLKEVEGDLAKNKADQEKQTRDIAEMKTTLENLKAKKVGN